MTHPSNTPTEDEREARAYSSPEAVAIAQRYLDRERRHSEVPEPSECRHGFDAKDCPLPESDDYERRRLREAADRMDPLADKPYTSLDLALVRDAAYRLSRAAQGEPSDAQLLAQGFRDGVDFIDDQPGPWGAAVVAGRAEAARRVAAAGGVR